MPKPFNDYIIMVLLIKGTSHAGRDISLPFSTARKKYQPRFYR